MSKFATIRANNIAVALETLKQIEDAVLIEMGDNDLINPREVAEGRIANAVAIYCAERIADWLDRLGDRIESI